MKCIVLNHQMKVDVVVLTKNSEETLRECLEAIYKNVPINRLIVVDGYSTDSTIDIINEFNKKYRNVLLISEKGTRGKARQTAIGMIQTEWFVFVDSDVLLCDKWFERAEKYIEDDVGAVWGIELWSCQVNITYNQILDCSREAIEFMYTGNTFIHVLYNPAYYPADPLKVSRGLEYRIGVGAFEYGTGSGLGIWPLGTGNVAPGGQIRIGFSIP